ncbi:MAG: hypothetical protein ACFCVK_22190 [Acidimicrobiales bacterium]
MIGVPVGHHTLAWVIAVWRTGRVDPDRLEAEQHARRSFTSRVDGDGTVVVTLRLAPLAGGTLTAAVDAQTLDDGTPLPDSTVARIVPTSFLRALIHDADARPVNASSRRRHPTTARNEWSTNATGAPASTAAAAAYSTTTTLPTTPSPTTPPPTSSPSAAPSVTEPATAPTTATRGHDRRWPGGDQPSATRASSLA